MMTDSFRPTALRNKAWVALTGKWGMSALACLIYLLTVFAPTILPSFFLWASFAFNILVVAIIGIGARFVWLDVSNGKNLEIQTLFEAFSDYVRYLVGAILVAVYTLLWLLLLVVPGIIKGISYSMTFYLMRENPQLSGEEAINLSMKMMQGHKMDFFLLQLSFTGWLLLGTITLGIGLLWIFPYMMTAQAEFYAELKKEYETREALS